MRRGLPALLLTTLARAAAAEVETEFAPFLHDSDRPQVLALDGPIDGRTPVMFQRALQRFADVTVLELSSDGGNVYDALPLAYVVRRVGLRASIPPGRSCASACTYLFFAGVGRDAEGQLGVHSIAMPSNCPEVPRLMVTFCAATLLPALVSTEPEPLVPPTAMSAPAAIAPSGATR